MKILTRKFVFLSSLLMIFNFQRCVRGQDREQCDNSDGDCRQGFFNDWEVKDVSDLLASQGRTPGAGGHNKYQLYFYETTMWCESIRPCPVYGGSPDASHNAENAADAFERDSTWNSGVVSRSELTDGGVWIKYSYPGQKLIIGSISFSASDDVTNFVFEGSLNGQRWSQLQHTQDGTPKRFKVKSSSGTDPPVAYHQYRLRITGTKWSEAGNESGNLSITNLQLCLLDDLKNNNDNKYTTSPPFVNNGQAFATSRWGKSWHENNAFFAPNRVWSSEYLYATNVQNQERWLDKPQCIGYSFPIARIVRKISFMGTYQYKYRFDHPTVFSFEGSNDGRSWTELLSSRISTFKSTEYQQELAIPQENIEPFRHFRMYVNQTAWAARGSSGGYLEVRAFRMC